MGWIEPLIFIALMLSAMIVLSFVGASKWERWRQLFKNTIESIGVFCLWLIRLIPKSLVLRIPAWFGIPVVISGLLTFVLLIAEIAKPFFREVFGTGQDKPKK